MTQQTMADRLYVARQAVSRWECGARYPDLLTTKRIAEVLETSIDELVSGEEIKRDVEQQPILMAPVSDFIQTILYTLGTVCYLVMGIGFGYIFLGISDLSADGLRKLVYDLLECNGSYFNKQVLLEQEAYYAYSGLCHRAGFTLSGRMAFEADDDGWRLYGGKGMAFVVLLLAALGQIAIAGLLMCQAYTLDKKRKQRNGFSDT